MAGWLFTGSGSPYVVATPWTEQEVQTFSFCQSADVLFVACETSAPQKVCRYGNTDWRVEPFVISAAVATPTGLRAAKCTSEEREYSYVVTAVDQFTLEESPPSIAATVKAARTISVDHPVTLTWNPVAGDIVYGIYKCWNESGKYGFVGRATSCKWVDRGVSPDFSEGFPASRSPFSGAGNYPSTVQFYQQRLCFGGTQRRPQTIWASCSGNYTNFNVSDPLRDDDSVVATIAAEKVNGISWMVPARQLLVGTSGSEWSLGGINGQPLSPSSLQFQRQSVNGAAPIHPIVVGENILFLQNGGSVIREMQYSLQKDGYSSTDLSILSEHIFQESPVVSWAYQQRPYSVIWCVRADGSLVACTYERDHDVVGWHVHKTDGVFETVCTISGEAGDELWCVVKRTVNGIEHKYVERLASFAVSARATEQFFVDSGVSYSGAPVTTLRGLEHLENKSVQILADGFVQPEQVVKQGQITLAQAASTVHVGLGYVSELIPLEPEIVLQDGTARGRTRKISRVCLQLHSTNGISVEVGSQAEQQLILDDILSETASMFSGDTVIEVNSGFATAVQMCVRQELPLPFTLLSYSMQLEIGER